MPHNNNFCYEFGPYSLEPAQRLLRRDGDPVSLTPKAAEILQILLKNAGQLVEKEELIKEIWPNTFVEEANLTQNIFTLRRVLGDDGTGPKYIETVSRRGYRFVAPVRKVAAAQHPSVVLNSEESGPAQSPTKPPIIAVLPFLNASGDIKVEYFADGITESIINSLSRISKLRVMSRSSVFRYKGKELDPQKIGLELGVDAVLVGKVHVRQSGLLISAELVDVANGWQLWGENFDRESSDIFEIQDEIARQLSATLRLRLTGDEEKRVTKRYTDNTEAYQAYLEGRYHWSKYTRESIEKAIVHFRRAIDLDPNYALAYAGIVDCYLRLATNYLPPEDPSLSGGEGVDPQVSHDERSDTEASQEKIRLRHEWDWKGAERELRRANELKSNYPAAHQWHAAFLFSRQLYGQSLLESQDCEMMEHARMGPLLTSETKLPAQISSIDLTPSEQVQVFCAIAREQIDAGNYEAACAVLQQWWTLGQWPKGEGLNPQSSADLLFTTGELAGWVASTRQVPQGQKHGESLLNGSIALFEHIGSKTRAAEGRIELALCYYRQGMFDLGRSTLVTALDALSTEDYELKSLGLVRLASLERHAGRLHDALARLTETTEIVKSAGPWATGRYHLELASTLKDLATSESQGHNLDPALNHYREALHEFEAIGNHRFAAIVENNQGYLLLSLGRFDGAEAHLLRARRLFDGFDDKVRRAQVDDTLARLHLAEERFELAEDAVERAVKTLQTGDEEALLAEALTTKGVVLCRQGRYSEAKGILEGAHRVAERCGDGEGAGRALLVMIEEMCEQLDDDERLDLDARLVKFLAATQQTSLLDRVRKSHEHIALAHRTKSGQCEN